jgi:AICAR transformylase/IMP cyclohydrolase PurH
VVGISRTCLNVWRCKKWRYDSRRAIFDTNNDLIVIAADINEAALEKVSQKQNVYAMNLNVASDEDWQKINSIDGGYSAQ